MQPRPRQAPAKARCPTGVHSTPDLRKLTAYRDGLPPEARKSVEILDKSEMGRVLNSDIHVGAFVKDDHGCLHPAKYVPALANRARALGVRIVTGWRCQATSPDRTGHLLRLKDDRQTVTIRAEKVLLSANGYIGPEVPWLRRRVIPVQSYMIAIEPLPFEQVEALIPENRVAGDIKHILY